MSLEQYINLLNKEYVRGTNNHDQHNTNPDYWDVLLKDVKDNPQEWEGKFALDFGCGKGRNVTNLLKLANFARVDGIDISQDNIDFCNKTYKDQPSKFYKNNGQDLSKLNSDEYDFVMSTIVFQHICVHELRINLKKEIYRVLKPTGIFSFQMGYGGMSHKGSTTPVPYFENRYDAKGSNGTQDVRVSNAQDLVSDLSNIGFSNITYEIKNTWSNHGHPNWIYVRCEK
jgi:SAM-dependent methyltransferase